MREDQSDVRELGAASELTQGSFQPEATEAFVIKDHWDEF